MAIDYYRSAIKETMELLVNLQSSVPTRTLLKIDHALAQLRKLRDAPVSEYESEVEKLIRDAKRFNPKTRDELHRSLAEIQNLRKELRETKRELLYANQDKPKLGLVQRAGRWIDKCLGWREMR